MRVITDMRVRSWCILGLFGSPLVLIGCGENGSSSGSDGSNEAVGNSGGNSGAASENNPASEEERQESGRTLFSMGLNVVQGVDTGSHEVVFSAPATEGSVDAYALDANDDQVWVGREDGKVVAIDRATQEVLQTLDLNDYASPDSDVNASHIVLGNGYAYSVANESIEPPPITRIDTTTFEVLDRNDQLPAAAFLNGMRYDGDYLWLVTWNAVALVKVDPLTLEALDTVELGQDPDDPNAFGDWYGYGMLAEVGNSAWVLDLESKRLLRVEKSTMEPSIAEDLSDLDLDTYLEFDANGDSVFLLLSEASTVIRFDGQTGERVKTYEFPDQDGIVAMALTDDMLYLRPGDIFNYEALEVDIETGETVQIIEAPVTMDGPFVVR